MWIANALALPRIGVRLTKPILIKTPDSDFNMKESKMQDKIKNHVGIDLGKRMLMAVRILKCGKLEWFKSKTDAIGRKRLIKWLSDDDVVGIEAGNLSFFLAKEIMTNTKSEVIILNAGDLAVIFRSLKKTDKEDSLKIARLIKRNPRNELPEVRIPNEYEEEARNLLSEQEYWTTSRTRAYNRLHSILTNSGITTVTKKEIKNINKRLEIIKQLSKKTQEIAYRLESEIMLTDSMLEKIEIEIKELLIKKKEDVKIIMSIPGIGIITTLAILGYLGDPSRFSNVKQVSYYVGLVPRVDQSGDTDRACRIIKRGCRQLRRTMVQCAWALTRSKYGGNLKYKYEDLKKRKGSGKAIVAIARKQVELVYHLLKKKELYKFMPENELNRKLAFNKIL